MGRRTTVNTKVAFQGEKGAYSQEAILQHFGPEVDTLPCRTFREIFETVQRGQTSHGALPVENSTAGSINEAYDLLLEHDLKIWHEVVLPVRHCLLGNPDTELQDVREVHSHPYALAQCERYLAKHGMEPVSASDTAGSARELATTPQDGVAVIASRLAAEIYGLEPLDTDIQDLPFNYTRFFFLSHQDPPQAERYKTSVVFTTQHVPGALYDCLGELAERGINLTKLESRPSRTRPWHYVFYLDFEGHRQDSPYKEGLLGLRRRASFVKVLGSYPAAPLPTEQTTVP
jgi:prephenate dehydratase